MCIKEESLSSFHCVRGTLGFMDRALHNQYELTTGKATRIYMTPKSATELRDFCTIDGEEVFSYGYVRSSDRPTNFSYTVMLSC